jgi:hypothetical protein
MAARALQRTPRSHQFRAGPVTSSCVEWTGPAAVPRESYRRRDPAGRAAPPQARRVSAVCRRFRVGLPGPGVRDRKCDALRPYAVRFASGFRCRACASRTRRASAVCRPFRVGLRRLRLSANRDALRPGDAAGPARSATRFGRLPSVSRRASGRCGRWRSARRFRGRPLRALGKACRVTAVCRPVRVALPPPARCPASATRNSRMASGSRRALPPPARRPASATRSGP